jgi:tRNA(Ile)-lysidine synthetase-like protein
MQEIRLSVNPGTYVVAVSGGVDSVVLLELLRQLPDIKLVVAHFDHGIREESEEDRLFVQMLAGQYGLPFVYMEGNLGAGASEAIARDARYEFLRQVMKATAANAIITAHHEDDLLETAILNILRGTGRKGLSSLKDTQDITRPLLTIPKKDIVAYAKDQGLTWREDSTNASTVYLRNYIRHKLMPHFDATSRQQLRHLIDSTAGANEEIDTILASHLTLRPAADSLNRHEFVMLPHEVSREFVAAWLRAHGIRTFDKKTIERIVAAAKTYTPGKLIDIDGGHVIRVEKYFLALTSRER